MQSKGPHPFAFAQYHTVTLPSERVASETSNGPRMLSFASSDSGVCGTTSTVCSLYFPPHGLASIPGKDKARVVGKAQRFTIKGRFTGQHKKSVQEPVAFLLAVHHGWVELTSDLCKTKGGKVTYWGYIIWDKQGQWAIRTFHCLPRQ